MASNQFSQERFFEAMENVQECRERYSSVDPREYLHALQDPRRHHDGHLHFLSECISVRVENHQVCLKVPVIGEVCIPVPSFIPDLTVGSACLELCTTFGIPTGVKVTLEILSFKVSKSFGKC